MMTRVTTLNSRTKELEAKKEIVKAQYQANTALIQIQKSITGLYDNAVDFAGALKELQEKKICSSTGMEWAIGLTVVGATGATPLLGYCVKWTIFNYIPHRICQRMKE